MLAHARLVTTDVGFTCFAFIATYYYWRSFYSDKKKTWIAAGVFLGLALLSKFTALLLLPVFGLLLLLWAWQNRTKDAMEGLPTATTPQSAFVQCLGKGALRLGLMLLVAVFVVNAGYGFKGSFKTLSSVPHESQLFETWDRSPLSKVPIPLPGEFVQGFDRQKLDAEQGVFLNYLQGKLSNKGWWYYFFYAFFIKTPIPVTYRHLILPLAWLSFPQTRIWIRSF